jgi:hypothetical protein
MQLSYLLMSLSLGSALTMAVVVSELPPMKIAAANEAAGRCRRMRAGHSSAAPVRGVGDQRSRKITERCTMKLITVAVPWAMTNATGTRHGWFSNCM